MPDILEVKPTVTKSPVLAEVLTYISTRNYEELLNLCRSTFSTIKDWKSFLSTCNSTIFTLKTEEQEIEYSYFLTYVLRVQQTLWPHASKRKKKDPGWQKPEYTLEALRFSSVFA